MRDYPIAPWLHQPLPVDLRLIPRRRGGAPPSETEPKPDLLLRAATTPAEPMPRRRSTRSTSNTSTLIPGAQTLISSLGNIAASPTERPLQPPRLIYDLGHVPSEYRADLTETLRDFHNQSAIQKKCADLELAANQFLRVGQSKLGRSIIAKTDIPDNTDLTYYMGIAHAAGFDPHSNHSMYLGLCGGTPLHVNASRLPKDLPLGACMHLHAHSCKPNGMVYEYIPDGWINDLALLVFASIARIKAGDLVTFAYKGCMFQPYNTLPTASIGFIKIRCYCDNPCPMDMGRLDWIETVPRLSPKEREKWHRGRITMLSNHPLPESVTSTAHQQAPNKQLQPLESPSSSVIQQSSKNVRPIPSPVVAKCKPLDARMLQVTAPHSTQSTPTAEELENAASTSELDPLAPHLAIASTTERDCATTPTSDKHQLLKMSPRQIALLTSELGDAQQVICPHLLKSGRVPTSVAILQTEAAIDGLMAQTTVQCQLRKNQGVKSNAPETSCNTVQALPPRPIPANTLDAEQALHDFDTASSVGPKLSSTRLELLARLRKFSAADKWEWVANLLQQFPALGNLKPGEHYQECRQYLVVTARVLNPDMPGPDKLTPDKEKLQQSMNSTGCAMELDRRTCSGKHLFNRTLKNYGNTCFFNALLQLLASIPSFVEQILETPLPPDHADSSYCLACLKKFIPAIASSSSDPCKVLDISSVGDVNWKMSAADWIDFVTRQRPDTTPTTP